MASATSGCLQSDWALGPPPKSSARPSLPSPLRAEDSSRPGSLHAEWKEARRLQASCSCLPLNAQVVCLIPASDLPHFLHVCRSHARLLVKPKISYTETFEVGRPKLPLPVSLSHLYRESLPRMRHRCDWQVSSCPLLRDNRCGTTSLRL